MRTGHSGALVALDARILERLWEVFLKECRSCCSALSYKAECKHPEQRKGFVHALQAIPSCMGEVDLAIPLDAPPQNPPCCCPVSHGRSKKGFIWGRMDEWECAEVRAVGHTKANFLSGGIPHRALNSDKLPFRMQLIALGPRFCWGGGVNRGGSAFR